MHKRAIKAEQISLYDLLTVDMHGEKIRVRNDREACSYALVPSRRAFFSSDGLYADVEKQGLTLIREEKKTMKLETLLEKWDASEDTCVVLLEGFAGCGKSTLVQYIFLKQLDERGYNYSFFDYDLEAQHNLAIQNKEGEYYKKNSIYEAIKRCFFEQFIEALKVNPKVFFDFSEILKICRGYTPFSNLYSSFFNTTTYQGISDYVKDGVNKNEDVIAKMLYEQADRISSSECLLALDYLLRLVLYKNKQLSKLYICYDNLDAIEDVEDLKSFDDELVKFSWYIDEFIERLIDKSYFEGCSYPHFVIFATYRKITAAMANISQPIYQEVIYDKYPKRNFVYHIDATAAFSYSKIVEKRADYFTRYFRAATDIPVETRRELLEELNSWTQLNKKLIIMHSRYACLWNRNYRTCSFIAQELYEREKYDFKKYVAHIESSKLNDGYYFKQDDEGNTVIGTYYGGSAILLSSVCKVFNTYKIWSNFLQLAPLSSNVDETQPNQGSYKAVSFSRIILTYIYNSDSAVSLEELFNIFCKNGLFSYKKLCVILANMLARNTDGVWRRPIYYLSNRILSEKAEDIEPMLNAECSKLSHNEDVSDQYHFILCDSGRAYVEHLMQEFEFFSNRLSNANKPLYLYDEISELEETIKNVYQAVVNCCKNMEAFRQEYIRVNGITAEQYLSLKIHPTTNVTKSPQLHTERIIFSHVAYLNSVRLYFLEKTVTPDENKRKKYNSMFVKHIKRYLTLYNTDILPVANQRQDIAKQLLKIVDEIQIAITQELNSPKILYQSISLRSKN